VRGLERRSGPARLESTKKKLNLTTFFNVAQDFQSFPYGVLRKYPIG